MTERYEKSPAIRLGILDGTQSIPTWSGKRDSKAAGKSFARFYGMKNRVIKPAPVLCEFYDISCDYMGFHKNKHQINTRNPTGSPAGLFAQKGVGQGFRGGLVGALEEFGVDVQGRAGLAVAQAAGHGAHIGAGANE